MGISGHDMTSPWQRMTSSKRLDKGEDTANGWRHEAETCSKWCVAIVKVRNHLLLFTQIEWTTSLLLLRVTVTATRYSVDDLSYPSPHTLDLSCVLFILLQNMEYRIYKIGVIVDDRAPSFIRCHELVSSISYHMAIH